MLARRFRRSQGQPFEIRSIAAPVTEMEVDFSILRDPIGARLLIRPHGFVTVMAHLSKPEIHTADALPSRIDVLALILARGIDARGAFWMSRYVFNPPRAAASLRNKRAASLLVSSQVTPANDSRVADGRIVDIDRRSTIHVQTQFVGSIPKPAALDLCPA